MYKKDFVTDFYYNFENYKVVITYKRIRNINYRYNDKEKKFIITAPYYSSQKNIFKYLEKFAPGLIKRASKKKEPFIGDNKVYLFGKLKEIKISSRDEIGADFIEIKQKENLNKLLKKELNKYIFERIKYYENLMRISPYKFSIKKMSTRYGSNSHYTHHISFSLNLVHYKKEIIDSIIVHELSHDKVRNHQKEFYDVVLKYFPKYYTCIKALNKTDYAFEGNYK